MTDKHTGESAAREVAFDLLATLWSRDTGGGWDNDALQGLDRWFFEKHGLYTEHPARVTDTELDDWTFARLLAYARDHASKPATDLADDDEDDAEQAGRPPASATVTASIEPHCQEVWLLHRWGKHDDEVTLWADKDSALKELAIHVRSNWANVAHEDGVPDQPPGDAREAIRLYYGPDGDRCDEGYSLYIEEIRPSRPASGIHTGISHA